jgi:hypothetical protein
MKYEDQERQDKNPQPKNSGSLYLARFGIGRWHFGKNDYQFSADTGSSGSGQPFSSCYFTFR